MTIFDDLKDENDEKKKNFIRRISCLGRDREQKNIETTIWSVALIL
jgi:hypothetical protein